MFSSFDGRVITDPEHNINHFKAVTATCLAIDLNLFVSFEVSDFLCFLIGLIWYFLQSL